MKRIVLAAAVAFGIFTAATATTSNNVGKAGFKTISADTTGKDTSKNPKKDSASQSILELR
jgi:hypothetical protein